MMRLKPGRTNEEERINFVRYWANYIKSVPDRVWSRQQNILINSQLQNAKYFKLSPKDYLEMKHEQCTRK